MHKNLTDALGLAAEIANMERREDYNYARLDQLRNDIDGLVGVWAEREDGSSYLAWPDVVCERAGWPSKRRGA